MDKILRSSYTLIQFAVYFSALVHDVEHPGVSNSTLAEEGDPRADRFEQKSCAGQNSIVFAWEVFMSKQYDDLRKAHVRGLSSARALSPTHYQCRYGIVSVWCGVHGRKLIITIRTGERGRIQASLSTAELLIGCGKWCWVSPREDSVLAKGKGVVKTLWVSPRTDSQPTTSESESITDNKELQTSRSIKWMTQLLLEYAKQIRGGERVANSSDLEISRLPLGEKPLEEVVEIINLKDSDATFAHGKKRQHKVLRFPSILRAHLQTLSPASQRTITRIHSIILSMVRSLLDRNGSLTFVACWVAKSADKFMKRIVAPTVNDEQIKKWKAKNAAATEIASHLYDFTHGISTGKCEEIPSLAHISRNPVLKDPVAQFAIIFSALIHDMDHAGVSNKQLQSEKPEMAEHYAGKSIAEQNSLDLAWSVFSMDKFMKLREFLFPTQNELVRFRQILVNVVLATDLFDNELNELRRNRWDKAFAGEQTNHGLRATIVIEHIIQASDV